MKQGELYEKSRHELEQRIEDLEQEQASDTRLLINSGLETLDIFRASDFYTP